MGVYSCHSGVAGVRHCTATLPGIPPIVQSASHHFFFPTTTVQAELVFWTPGHSYESYRATLQPPLRIALDVNGNGVDEAGPRSETMGTHGSNGFHAYHI